MAIERKSRQKVKGVAFNLDDPADVELLQWAEKQGKFSTYVKRLIDLDRRLNGHWGGVASPNSNDDQEEAATVEDSGEWDLDPDDIDDDLVM